MIFIIINSSHVKFVMNIVNMQMFAIHIYVL
jgi:hypothetical protein